MAKLMKRGRVEMSSVLEGCKSGQADEIAAGQVVGLAKPFSDGGAAGGQELVNCGVAFICIARLHVTRRHDPIR
jgi:hypothetical protein